MFLALTATLSARKYYPCAVLATPPAPPSLPLKAHDWLFALFSRDMDALWGFRPTVLLHALPPCAAFQHFPGAFFSSHILVGGLVFYLAIFCYLFLLCNPHDNLEKQMLCFKDWLCNHNNLCLLYLLYLQEIQFPHKEIWKSPDLSVHICAWTACTSCLWFGSVQ